MPGTIIYDPKDIHGQNPISIQTDQGSFEINDPDRAREFIAIANQKDETGNPDLNNIKTHLNTMGLDIGDDFSLVETEPNASNGEQIDVEGEAPMGGTQGTVAPGQENEDMVNQELELAIDLQSVESTDNIIKEIINMNIEQGKLFTEKEKKHQKTVDAYKERLVSDDFIGEMATVMEDDREAATSLKHNKIKTPEGDGFEQDIDPDDDINNSTDQSAASEYADDIAPHVDEDTISRPLDAENNYMNAGVDTYNVPVNDATEGDGRATTAKTGTEEGEYADPKSKKTLDDSGWNLANYKEEGLSKEEYDFLMEEIDENAEAEETSEEEEGEE